MNIFVLDQDPVLAARAQVDRHVVKMVLETAQMLSTVSARFGGLALYAPTHARHPCTLWAGESRANWDWLVTHGIALAEEYTRRYGKEHRSHAVISGLKGLGGRPPAGSLTPFAQAMPEEPRDADPVVAYRRYYITSKAHIATWKHPAERPEWWPS